MHFGIQLIAARNRAQRPGMDHAVLAAVLVYRGQPLKYRYERDAAGQMLLGVDGKRVVESKGEKGIDVLCALAVVRQAQRPDVDLVILASHDSDLEPALDEALALGSAKIETFSWCDPVQRHRIRQLRPGSGRTIWNTRLGETEFRNCWDLTKYP